MLKIRVIALIEDTPVIEKIPKRLFKFLVRIADILIKSKRETEIC